MFEEKDLANLFGKPDDEFNNNFNNTLTKLRAAGGKAHRRRMSTKAITIIIIVCIIALSGTAYAVSYFTMQYIGNKESVDTGGGFMLVAVTENEWKDTVEIGAKAAYFPEYSADLQPRFNADHAEALRLLFAGEVFTADGESVDFLVLDPDTNEYYIDGNGSALFNKYGEELAEIYYVPEDFRYDGKPVELELWWTKAYKEEQRQQRLIGDSYGKLTYDYDDAVNQMNGHRFRLPAVFEDRFNFDAIEFSIQKPMPAYYYNEETDTYDEVFYDFRGVTVYVRIAGNPGLYYWAEAPKEENNPSQTEWLVGVDRIEEWHISETDTTVHKLISSDGISYTWKHMISYICYLMHWVIQINLLTMNSWK